MGRAALLSALLTAAAAGSPSGPLEAQPGQARPAAAAPASPFVGTWIANLPHSKLHPSSQFQSVTLQIAVGGDTMTMASEIVNTSGHTQHAAETFRTDGRETPGTLSAGVTLMAKWLGPHVLASIATRNGQVYALVTYQVSADGGTLTSRSSGAIEQVLVFDRK
jgi:hypothetical protein